MGSKVWFKNTEDYYILGLWLADGYWRSSSFGLSSSDRNLLKRFRNYLKRKVPQLKIKVTVYRPQEGTKRRKIAKHIYINNREITRFFLSFKKGKLAIPNKYLFAYFAGRIDGDGSLDRKYRTGLRIAYSNFQDAKRDSLLLGEENVSIYEYISARTWVIYFRKFFLNKFLPKVSKFSTKLLPRRD